MAAVLWLIAGVNFGIIIAHLGPGAQIDWFQLACGVAALTSGLFVK